MIFQRTRVMVILIALLPISCSQASLAAQQPPQDSAAKANPDNQSTSSRLKETIAHLSQTIGERNLHQYAKLTEAASYVTERFEKSGYRVERQTFQVHELDCHNLIVELTGKRTPKEIVLVGAHYDSARGTPGANDNGSGTAALLELAHRLHGKSFAKTIRFVAFTNEEPPYFQQAESMGSWIYAKSCRARSDELVCVMSLETMGYFSDEANSQKYPPLLASLYPSTGNFIGFVSNLESRKLLTDVVSIFRKHCAVDAQLGALPGSLQGVGWSDHWSFWQEGYAGIMVTDTAPFRYPHYHESTDTIDKLDFERFGKVVDGLVETVADIAGREP